MNAVIIYDDRDTAVQARAALDRAAHCAGGALLWTVEPWPLALLSLPVARDAALHDAAPAHLILLALSRTAGLFPAALLDWLDRWAARREIQDAALALLDGGNGGTLPAKSAPAELCQFAQRQGLSFITGSVRPASRFGQTGRARRVSAFGGDSFRNPLMADGPHAR
jgi:hypothetical protein